MIDAIYSFDFKILDFIQALHNNALNFIMKIFTYAGDNGYIWIAAALVLLIIPKTRKIGIYLTVTLIAEAILNDKIIKAIVGRSRPFLQREGIDTIITPPSGYSFPSGHTASSFACATAIYMHNKKLGIIAYIISFFIALSRLYFYVHFPSDVIVGTMVGIFVGIGMNKLLKYIEKKATEKKS